jgi:hypothetical protein
VQDRERKVEIFEPIGQAKVDDRQSCHAPQTKSSPEIRMHGNYKNLGTISPNNGSSSQKTRV